MKEEQEIISEYFTKHYPQKRTIPLNEIAGEIAATLSSGANIAGTVIGFGALALVALIIYFLIRNKKPDYGYVTGNVRDSGTYGEMTSTLDRLIAGKNSPEDQEALENYKRDLEQFKKEDQRIIEYLQKISKVDQDGFEKTTVDGIKDLTDILLKIQSNKDIAEQEIKIRKIVLQVQKDNPKSPILQKLCINILDSLKNKEEIIKKATGYQKLILKISSKNPKIPKKLLSMLMFGLPKEEADDLLKKADELAKNKEKIIEFLKGKPIPFVLEKIDGETGVNIKISFDDNKKDGEISLKDKIEIIFDDKKLNSKFIPEDLIIEQDKDKFLLDFVELQNNYPIFYKNFLESFDGEIAELKNFKPSSDTLKNLKGILIKYIDPAFLEKINEYVESSKETKDKNADFKGELDSQVNTVIKKIFEFIDSEIKRFKSETLEKTDLTKSYTLNEIKKQIRTLIKYKKDILFSKPANDLQKKYNNYFEQNIKDILSKFIKSCQAKIKDLNISALPEEAKKAVEKLELEKEGNQTLIKSQQAQIEELNKKLKNFEEAIREKSNSENADEIAEQITGAIEEIQTEVEVTEGIASSEVSVTPDETATTPEEKKSLIKKLKELGENQEIIQDVNLDIKDKKFTSSTNKTDSYVKFLSNGKLEVYSRKPIDELSVFTNIGFAFEAEEGYKLVFTGKYSTKKNKINIYKLKPVEKETPKETPKEAPKENETELLNILQKYKKLLENLYKDDKKYKDLNDGQKRLVNLIDTRNSQIAKENNKSNSIKDISDQIDSFIVTNGSSKTLKDEPNEDFFINLDKDIEKIDVKNIEKNDYPEGAPPKIEEKSEEPVNDTATEEPPMDEQSEQENEVTFSEGDKWTSSDLYNILINDKLDKKNITWDIFCYYIEIKDKKITIFKDEKNVKDFYIVIRNRKPKELLPFEIYKKNKDANPVEFNNDYLYQEAEILKKVKERISLGFDKIFSRKDEKVYEGNIKVKEDGITFSDVKSISTPDKKETPKIKEVVSKKAKEITLTAKEKLSKLFKFLDPKTKKEEKDEIIDEIPELFGDEDVINLDTLGEIKNELEIKTPLELAQEVPIIATTELTSEESQNNELGFSNSKKLMLDKDFNITNDEASAIIFGYDAQNKNIWIDNKTGETNFFIKSKNAGRNLSTNLNLFFDKDKQFDDQKTNLILSDATPKGTPKNVKIKISKKDGFKDTNIKEISFNYQDVSNESYKNKNIKKLFQEIFIKEIKKPSFYFD